MKKLTTLRSGIRKAVYRLSILSFLFITSFPLYSRAQDKQPANAVVSYVGDLDGLPVFQVFLNNKNRDVYTLTIKDENGTIFYSEKFRDKSFSKKIKFDKTDHDDVSLSFILSGGKEDQQQVFRVNTNVQVIKDVVVTKL